jgi:hypothetical protein
MRGDNATGKPIEWYHSVRAEFGWQATGAEMWHQVWNYPYYGIGFYAVDYFKDDELGRPLAIYGFAYWPLVRKDRISFGPELGFGISFNWKPFDPFTNPYNVAIGDFQSVYIDGGFSLNYRVSPRWYLIGSATFTHFSNGGSRRPNWGINQIGLLARLQYNLREEQLPYKAWEVPEYQKNWEWIITPSVGNRDVIVDTKNTELSDAYLRENYIVASLTSLVYRQISYKSKFGAGLDLVYDTSTDAQIDTEDGTYDNLDVPLKEEFRVGIFGGYEFVMHRYSVLLHVGYHLIQKEKNMERMYQRIGVKYHIFENIFVGLNTRFQNFSQAAYLEWNIGYRLRK